MKLITSLKIKNRRQVQRTLPLAFLLAAAFLLQAPESFSQEKPKTYPNGTDGLIFTQHAADTVFVDKTSDLEGNEFVGKYATFRIGMGYIGDFTAYSQDKVFKQQMDSANLDLNATLPDKGFSYSRQRQAFLKLNGIWLTNLLICMMVIKRYG